MWYGSEVRKLVEEGTVWGVGLQFKPAWGQIEWKTCGGPLEGVAFQVV